jgi:septal ring factor EnvC (AmiA/AmiB activator)
MSDETELVKLVTQGLAGIHEQLRERDTRVSALSDKIIGMEYRLDEYNRTLNRMGDEISKAETVKLQMRVGLLETAADESKKKQAENVKWIKGLIASVIMLLLGVLFNFIRIGLRP